MSVMDAIPTDNLATDTLGESAGAANEGLPALPDSQLLQDTNHPDPAQTAFQNALNPQVSPTGLPLPKNGGGIGGQIIAAAEKYLGQPYSWGNLDCLGLIQRAYKAVGINLPRISFQQGNYGKRVGLDQLRPGDLVAWDNSSRNNGADHIAIWLGNGMILESDHPGGHVKITKMFDSKQAWGVSMPW